MAAKTPAPVSNITVVTPKSKPVFWLSLAAFLVSLASLTISIQQTNLAAEQKEASVWPYLQFHTSTSNDEFRFTVQNKGIGPALIKKIEVKNGGKVYSDFYLMMQENDIGRPFHHTYASLEGLVLSPQESRDLILVQDSTVVQKVFSAFLDGLEYKVAFASVYGKQWLVNQDTVLELGSLAEFGAK